MKNIHVGGKNKKNLKNLGFFSCRDSFSHVRGLLDHRI